MLFCLYGELASLEGECTHRPLRYATTYVDKRKGAVLVVCQDTTCRIKNWIKEIEPRRE